VAGSLITVYWVETIICPHHPPWVNVIQLAKFYKSKSKPKRQLVDYDFAIAELLNFL